MKLRTNRYFLNTTSFKIDNIFKFELAKFMFLSNIKALPEVFESYFSSLEQEHSYSTRSKSNRNYFVDTVQTRIGKNLLKFNEI